MLEKLQRLLIEQKTVLRLANPERGVRVAQGLRQLQIAMFVVQVGLIFLVMLGILLTRGSSRVVEVWTWFLVIGVSLHVFAAVFSERAFREEPSFPTLMRFCILTAVSSAIPAMLAALAFLFEGFSWGVLGLLASSLVAFVIGRSRLELLSFLVPQLQEND